MTRSARTHAPTRVERTTSSALWAAWGDALGFISELTDDNGLRRRLRGHDLVSPRPWRRRVGGKFGTEIELLAGCYSDDTQLRLATSRAISSRGFDAEAFASVELGIWPSYALGGGRSTKAAASNISKANRSWYTNFYDGWHSAGGNGAAMRVQPHVWAAPVLNDAEHILRDVIRNSVVTHGSPVALLGACLHALSLAHTLNYASVPEVEEWPDLWRGASKAITTFSESMELATIWVPAWEAQAGSDFGGAWGKAVDDCRSMLTVATEHAERLRVAVRDTDPAQASRQYEGLLQALDLYTPNNRGSGLGTAIAALALSTACTNDARTAALIAASAVGSDTDSIATMASAICGASELAVDHPDVLDAAYIEREAVRLGRLAQGSMRDSFRYPDLLHWVAPRSQLDCVGLSDESLAIAGLGRLTVLGDTPLYKSRDAAWRWCRTDFGQTILVKQRFDLRPLPLENLPPGQNIQRTSAAAHDATDPVKDTTAAAPSVRGTDQPTRNERPGPVRKTSGIDEMINWIARRGFKDDDIGYGLRRFAADGSVEQVVAFAVVLQERMRVASAGVGRQP